ncbi:MAG TPA: hypothetical protein DCM17_02985, partial [Dehalococcoidia bacterium]|nr:hypothetical protein [Dehalococcoidia bacterium]
MPGHSCLARLVAFQIGLVYTLPRITPSSEAKAMAISKDTLKAMIRDFHGFELSDSEMDLIAPELDAYLSELEKLRELDLSKVMSSRLIKA